MRRAMENKNKQKTKTAEVATTLYQSGFYWIFHSLSKLSRLQAENRVLSKKQQSEITVDCVMFGLFAIGILYCIKMRPARDTAPCRMQCSSNYERLEFHEL